MQQQCNDLCSVLFDLSPEPIAITQPARDRVIEVNETWLRTLGHAYDRTVGASWKALGVWADQFERDRVLERVASSGRVSNHRTRFLRADGAPIEVLLSGAEVDVNGEDCVLWAWRDVTEQARAVAHVRELNASLEQRVAERTAALESANRDLESFSYSVSHDLRSPLGIVHGFAHLLRVKEGPRLSGDGLRLLDHLERNAQHMIGLVDGLLDFARLGARPLARKPVSMAALVGEVLQDLKSDPAALRAEYRIGTLPDCRGDAMLLKQVWQNLLGNAVKYSRGRSPALIEIGHDAADGRYFVRDNGAGFDMQYAGKLFSVFERLHGEEEFEGTGVGLAIVRRILQRHGGEISAQSRPGEGATFRFSLPAD